MADIHHSTQRYETWLRRQLGKDLVEADLRRKHEKMRESPFAFLRATYWRWAEIALETCPDAAAAPQVLAVGDIHLENFGTWRDADGRLVWGVNDFDEAAEMPYVLDLIRLATSALVAGDGATAADAVCTALLEGYRKGLRTPQPIVLERDWPWLREALVVSEKKRSKFWKNIGKIKSQRAPLPYRKALASAMPETGIAIEKTARRIAGAGSLGRPRWIGVACWRGAPVVREAKRLVPSGWLLAHAKGKGKNRSSSIARGRYRAIDPWFGVAGDIAVRRLSPNNRKIEADDDPSTLLSATMLEAMGMDLAAVHLGTSDHRAAIRRDLARRKTGWLEADATRMMKAVAADFAQWTGATPTTPAKAK